MERLRASYNPSANLTTPLVNFVEKCDADGGSADHRHGKQHDRHHLIGGTHPPHLRNNIVDAVSGINKPRLQPELERIRKYTYSANKKGNCHGERKENSRRNTRVHTHSLGLG